MQFFITFSLIFAMANALPSTIDTLAEPSQQNTIKTTLMSASAQQVVEHVIERVTRLIAQGEGDIIEEIGRTDDKINKIVDHVSMDFPEVDFTASHIMIERDLWQTLIYIQQKISSIKKEVNQIIDEAEQKFNAENTHDPVSIAEGERRINEIVGETAGTIENIILEALGSLIEIYQSTVADIDAMYNKYQADGDRDHTVTKGKEIIKDGVAKVNKEIDGVGNSIKGELQKAKEQVRDVVRPAEAAA